MQITVINSNNLQKDFSVTIPFKEVNANVEEKIRQAQKHYVLPGFRKGTVPVSLVRNKISKIEIEKALHSKISEAVNKIIQGNHLTFISRPKIELINFIENQEWKFKIIFQLLPNIPNIVWSDIEVKRVSLKITDEDMQIVKNSMLKDFRNFRKNNDSNYQVKHGDKVHVDFIGKIHNRDFEGNTGNDVEIAIGEGNFSKDFENGCIGMKVNDAKNVDVKFAHDYANKELSNKTASFNITMKVIFEMEPIKEIDQNTLDKIGVTSISQLNEQIKNKINYDFVPTSRNYIKKQIFDIIDKRYDFDLPEEMIQQDVHTLETDYKKNKTKYHDHGNKTDSEIKEILQNIARKRVKSGIVIANISQQNNIQVKDEELQTIIHDEASKNPKLKNKILDFYKNPEHLKKVKSQILEEKTFEYILKKIKMNDVTMESKEFLKLFK